ncbi:MAG: threonine synthase, partial [Alphaproteobacteria bacterium]|nr:threonine synthase [Alphaproteobacteria bacterium]
AMTALRADYDSGMVDEAGTSATITRALATTGELLCPHSAVGVDVAERHLQSAPATPMITLATAHPAKFPDAVEAATGIRPPLPNRMSDLYERNERVVRIDNSLSAIETLIEERIAK